MLKKLVQSNPDVRFVYKNYALPNHPFGRPAALAAAAAGRQNKFWEMHDLLFQNQGALDDASIHRYAQSIGLDMQRFDKDLADPELAKFVDGEGIEARRVGVTGTPTVFVDGVKAPSWDEGTLTKLITAARNKEDVGKAAGQIVADLRARQAAQQRVRRQPDNTVYDIDIKGAPFRGPADAPVTVVAFSDYQ